MTRAFETTYGDYETEDLACQHLDSILNKLTSFVIHKEVPGELMQPRYGTEDRGVRIDRLLVPRPSMAKLGWCYGCIGIECKRSGKKVGRPISQILDYTRAIWQLTDTGVNVYCRYIFLWPMHKTSGPLASIMAQNNIGTASAVGSNDWYRLALQLGESNLLQFYPNTLELKINEKIQSGSKTGSR